MAQRDYVLPVSVDSEIRMRHTIERGDVIEFMVELVVQGQPVIRYDSAHGFAHIDRYNLDGEQTKEPLGVDFNTALTMGEQDLKQNWAIYHERFLEGTYP